MTSLRRTRTHVAGRAKTHVAERGKHRETERESERRALGRSEGEGHEKERLRPAPRGATTKCHLYRSPREGRYGLLFGLGIGPLFLEAGFKVRPPPKIDLWRQFV